MQRILLFAAVLSLLACHREPAPEPAVQTVRAGAVEQIVPDAPERYSASIEAIAQVDLAFKSAGVISAILQVHGADGRMRNVQPGDQVAKDAELAQVRSSDYQHRVDQAQAQVAQAEGQLAQAQAQVTQVQANYAESEIEYTRAKSLYDSASLVKPQYDQAKGRYDSLQASMKGAEAAVASAQAAVAATRAGLRETELSLSDTALHAPFAGWITARNVDVGSLVSGAATGFSLLDTHLVKAVFAVPDSSLATVHLGQRQPVMLDALQHAAQGIVTSISPQADPKTRSFSVEVTLPNPREEIRPGMIGSLTLSPLHDHRPRLVVPLGAVVRAPSDPNGFAVFTLRDRDGKTFAAAQTIEVGQTFGNSIEVTQGLAARQRIIALGGSLVHDGQEVRVLP